MVVYRARRVLAGVGVLTAAALLGTIQPAAAAPGPVNLRVEVPAAHVAPGSAGQVRDLTLRHDVVDRVALEDVVIVVDASGLAGVATIQAEFFGCTTSGLITTCDVGDTVVDEFGFTPAFIRLVAAPGATIGRRATFTARVTAANATGSTSTVNVTIAEGVSLTDATGEVERSTTPGGSVTAPLAVRNTGDTTVKGVLLFIGSEGPVAPARRHSNCGYDAFGGVCTFDTDLAPGTEYGLSEEIRWTVRPDAEAPLFRGSDIFWMTPEDAEAFLARRGTLTPGTGAPLRLEPRVSAARDPQTDPDSSDNFGFVDIQITGSNPTDLAGVGAMADGDAGATVVVKPGVKNLGPASRWMNRSGSPVVAAKLVMPPGTTVTAAPRACVPRISDIEQGQPGEPGHKVYLCFSDVILVQQTLTFEFSLRIDQVIEDAKGTVEANFSEFQELPPDPNPANDTASIVINPSGGGGGGLPITGTDVVTVSGAGAVLLAVGVGIYVMGRRRRIRFVTPKD